jgi:hypothetical protein
MCPGVGRGNVGKDHRCHNWRLVYMPEFCSPKPGLHILEYCVPTELDPAGSSSPWTNSEHRFGRHKKRCDIIFNYVIYPNGLFVDNSRKAIIIGGQSMSCLRSFASTELRSHIIGDKITVKQKLMIRLMKYNIQTLISIVQEDNRTLALLL